MRTLIFIGIGGMIGSIARYLTGQFFTRFFSDPLPVGTLVVNIAGTFLIGIIIGMGERFRWFTEPWHFFLAVGFCGSFTTYSTFAFENYTLIKQGHYTALLLYVIISLIAGVLLAWGGYVLSKWI
ncbi:MAG: fluoride efflux transporter CrcB [Cyclobacteriaceae bacterium]|nr:fluoride efflux transporter CrcB [Cyclobacteriaceae bacterium]